MYFDHCWGLSLASSTTTIIIIVIMRLINLIIITVVMIINTKENICENNKRKTDVKDFVTVPLSVTVTEALP